MAAGDEVATEQRLKEAAVRLFGARGFASTGIRELARESDISVASLYHYMDSKDDLLLALMMDGMRSLLEPARNALRDISYAPARIVALVDTHIDFHCNRADLARVTDTEIRALSMRARRQVIDLRDEYEGLWLDSIITGVQTGAFLVAEPRLATFALLEMCTGVSHWYSPRGRFTARQISDHYARLALQLLGGTGADLELPASRTSTFSVARARGVAL